MNVNLQKIYNQSFVPSAFANANPKDLTLKAEFDPNKFGRLIIKELCGLMERAQDDLSSINPTEINWGYISQLDDWIKCFKNHFGVEE